MAGSKRRRAGVRTALAGVVGATVVVVVTGATAIAPSPTGAQSVPAGITGLEKVQSPVVTDTARFKKATAACPGNKAVVGGGGWVFETSGDHPERLTLTRLEPTSDIFDPDNITPTDGPDGFIAEAAQTSPGATGPWWVQAYALCADRASVPGWELERSFTGGDPGTVKRVSVGCDAADTGKRILGTGARIDTSIVGEGEVVLQVARMSEDGRLARAQAHVDASGFGDQWRVGAYAICATTPPGYAVVTGRSAEELSEPDKDAHVACPSGRFLLGAGAAITDMAPGHVSLQQVYPRSSLRAMDAFAVENTPLPTDWDFIVTRGACAFATPEG